MWSMTKRERETEVLDLPGALDRINGDQRLLNDIAVIFQNDGPRLLESLNSAVNAHDVIRTETSAHALKGIAANVGGLRVERAALAVEDAARANQMELATIATQCLKTEVDRLVDALERMMVAAEPERAS
jgi:two-component system, sensor histidine kinase and response regulator